MLYIRSGGRERIKEKIKSIEARQDYIKLENISPTLVFITLALEDDAFFSHRGVNPESLRAAFKTNIKARQIVMGGSTLTQQLAKNLLFDFNKAYTRKIAELFAVKVIEGEYSKEKILEIYLNCIEYGNGNWCIKSACSHYSDMSPFEIELQQVVSLISLLPSPKKYDPVTDRDKFMAARSLAVDVLEKKKYIRPKEGNRIRVSEPFEKEAFDPDTERFYREIYRNALRVASSNKAKLKVEVNSVLAEKILNKKFLSNELSQYAEHCHKNVNTRYMWGGIMDYITKNVVETLLKRYPSWYQDNEGHYRGLVESGAYGCDCSGLIKSYLFGGSGRPGYEEFYDLNSKMLLSISDRKGKIDVLPEVKGICLYMPGHVGIYAGNGQVVECTNNISFGDGVVQTNIGDRLWTDWFYCPFIKYEE
ncbi:MAG: transglycosylase domain-containing protein [Candidatus Pelethousia sp.]|nr:transglycosylase domain-containing protein [Candidatus Pelethousia sp.]